MLDGCILKTSFSYSTPFLSADQEQPPAKYNSKLMNSIWGLYNRYSVHNLKKVTEGEEALQGVQQL